ncbi:DUF429 domain-containing protein [Caulobacter flavus]|uniref:DUF429 domain-containing protein n=1 Tax=Caulobacter flavus TaxID=1679497 RepID=A0A2N5CZC9_9CAUL|nr:DUF429 domain-containing protein [Caulobacter flavus]AYV45178.1 DUF429 domain-containing protein [Caulobacter flavus]PLR19142.1 DUF429 domain-containing protein [Caulobacter flavus]
MLVLGVDAAWTATEPSGLALISDTGGEWRLLGVASSYDAYLAPADHDASQRWRGSVADPGRLLERSASIASAAVDIVAVDMPLAHEAITCRRAADNAVSRAYGGRACGTHTPSATRPGPISDNLRAGFALHGYDLLTTGLTRKGLMEVYPHPALVELAKAPRRLPYKMSKQRAYWPDLAPALRRERLLGEWRRIVTLLDHEIAGTAAMLPLPALDSPAWRLKAFEDALDAAVCAWIGACASAGGCSPFGDEIAAIWIPQEGFSLRRAAP